MQGAYRVASIGTVIAVAALAFTIACVAHEALAHGIACKAAGGEIALLTSVYFHCSEPGRFVAAAGPLANMALGMLLAFLPRSHNRATSLFFALTAATNLLWGSGYFVFSGITGTGDMASAVQDWGLELTAASRAALTAAGIAMYFLALRRLGNLLAPDAPLVLSYLGIGVTSCLATLFYNGPTGPALLEAFQQGFLATIGLPLIAWRREHRTRIALPPPHAGWLLAAAVTLPLFFSTLGLGLGLVSGR
ncbi:hypothetical protein [Pseudorhodoferax sp. Leaf274]|uniref:hypothetical protein n=1 Tax=Pseudorhodoferax sp. Leaf274 TaxID=1736318 RepID=UPI0007039275|nr:hypothetical protein [Pseudorhodoferax sp. Leaf274]KQP41131.1 hypothetical protein ASF44_30265 [Pseudorhodoferax sp. Leaf274]